MAVEYVITAFAAMLIMMIVGLPIAVAMAAVGIIGGVAVYGAPFMNSISPVIWGVQNNSLLTSIPLFVLLGELLLRAGIADGMYKSLSVWLGRLPGGLLHSNIGTCALFAATSGSSVATAATVGTVALPSLNERNYKMSKSLGSLAAGGALGILIPPSVNLIIYGSLTNTSIGQLFVGGVVPGILLTLLFMAFIAASSIFDKTDVKHETKASWAERWKSSVDLIPPLVIFLIVMGSIYSGLATATESAALGVVAALFFTALKKRCTWSILQACFIQTARVSGMILLIITAAFILNLTISLTGVAEAMSAWVTSLGLSTVGFLLALVVFYLILGMFMDVLSMQVATIPITYPMSQALGIDPVWFGIFVVMMCELGLITPPVGMNLFVVQGIRPDNGSISDVMKGAVPFVALMLVFTLALIAIPQIVTWLHNLMKPA
jgi:tripartite ATP-independent transporter DctM subunit